jgi:hypothetical protein
VADANNNVIPGQKTLNVLYFIKLSASARDYKSKRYKMMTIYRHIGIKCPPDFDINGTVESFY